jgi:hypothetical protein
MTQIDYITLYHHGRIHVIQREPFETNMDVYKRGWFIINNKAREADAADALKLQSISLIEIYKNKGMSFDM